MLKIKKIEGNLMLLKVNMKNLLIEIKSREQIR